MKIPVCLVAVLVLLAACQQQLGKESADHNDLADSTVGAPSNLERKIVQKAQLQFEVADVQKGSEAIGQLARAMGGSLSYAQVAAETRASRSLPHGADSVLLLEELRPSATLTARVPAGRLEEFLYGAARLSSFLRFSELSVDDKTLDYLELQWRADARNKVLTQARPVKRIDSAGLAIADDVITQRIAQRSIDEQVRYSTISISLTQPPLVRRSIVVNADLAAYDLTFGQRLRSALAEGWRMMEQIVLAGAHVWALLLLLVIAWIGWRRWGRKLVAGNVA